MANETIGVVGLGRMGEAIVHRLVEHGYTVIAYDSQEYTRSVVKRAGVRVVDSLERVAHESEHIWLMVPAGAVVDQVIKELIPYCSTKTVIIDGGNSHFNDSVKRASWLAGMGIAFLDCGTSGGLKGREIGFSLMVGGARNAFDACKPFLTAIAADKGLAYVGLSGAGHYVKMVHNGIEYALLQSYAEGFNLLKQGSYPDLDLEKIAAVWLHGSVIRSWILDLAYDIFKQDQELATISGAIGENKTGEWTVGEARMRGVPVDLIERSLQIRAESRETGGNFATKIVSLLRNKFGGHPVQTLKHPEEL